MVWLIDNLTETVESKNIISNGTSSATFHLVLVSKQSLSGVTASIVQFAMSQNSQQSWFACVNIAYNSNAANDNKHKIPIGNESNERKFLIRFNDLPNFHEIISIDVPSNQILSGEPFLWWSLP